MAVSSITAVCALFLCSVALFLSPPLGHLLSVTLLSLSLSCTLLFFTALSLHPMLYCAWQAAPVLTAQGRMGQKQALSRYYKMKGWFIQV